MSNKILTGAEDINPPLININVIDVYDGGLTTYTYDSFKRYIFNLIGEIISPNATIETKHAMFEWMLKLANRKRSNSTDGNLLRESIDMELLSAERYFNDQLLARWPSPENRFAVHQDYSDNLRVFYN